MIPKGGFEGVVLVFEGSINPRIFTHRWLTEQNLVSEKEAEETTVHFQDPDLSRFDVSHFRIEARRDRVTVSSAKALETFLPVGDFMQGIFEVLVHTPISAVDISKVVHAELRDGGLESIREKLVPADPWQGIVFNPRLQILSLAGDRIDKAPGMVEVTVEESQHVEGGLYIVATERIEVEDPIKTGRGARDALHALKERYAPWLARADEVIDEIKRLA